MNFGAFHLPTAITTALVVVGAIAVIWFVKEKVL